MLSRNWSTPWRQMDVSVPSHVKAVPTMVTPDEKRMLTWAGWRWWTGAGAVVDLGSYIGGAAARLAHGMSLNGAPGAVVAYDRFTTEEGLKHRLLYPAGVPRFEGENMFPAAQSLLAPLGDRIDLRRGDVRRMAWDGEPIEILHVDLATSPAMTAHVLSAFVSRMAVGGLLIHQDYLHPRNPWIPAVMEHLSECFEPVAACRRNAVLFRVLQTPAPERLAEVLAVMTDSDHLIRLIRAAQMRLPKAHHRAALSHAILIVKASGPLTPGAHSSHLTDPEPDEAELYELDPLAET